MFFYSKKTIVTHNGSFHADDVFAAAALSILLNGKIKIIRTRDPKIIRAADYVVDVGNVYDPPNNRFDHHQSGGPGKRMNGISYASFGLVWKEFGPKICGSPKIAEIIENRLVMPIDAYDNGEGKYSEMFPGVFPYTVNDIIGALNPAPEEIKFDKPIADGAFSSAVEFAKELLKGEIKSVKSCLETEEILKQSYLEAKDKRIIVVNRRVPIGEYFSSYPEPFFIVYQYADGGWAARAVRKNPNNFESRKLFPDSWAGKRDAELVAITGVSDAIFCHNKGFLAIAKSKEGAIRLAKLALENI